MTSFIELDSEEINVKSDKPSSDRPDDFLSIIVNEIYNFDWIFILAVIIAYLFVVSDTFNEYVISSFSGTHENNGELSTYGYIVQGSALIGVSILARILFAVAGV